ncbi:hypothetical protein [Oceanobacillus senegalensis]|uniref:hypothetical protein n=1 Tax=Oceanobacillus senegalensis TaxID=1936063 RepID=UPI000A30439F|nr:hypothetical protein [Oceanobacillus senegalensis]
MKYTIISIILITILMGCSNDTEPSTSTKSEEKSDSSVIHAEQSDENYVNNPQAPDTRSLDEIGQVYNDEDGTVVLKSITDYHKSHKIGPVKLTISNIKVMNYEPAMHLIDYFHGFTNNEMKFNYVKFHITMENTSDRPIHFAPVSILETNTGEMKGFEDDFYLQNLNGVMEPKGQKSGELAFILDGTPPENLSKITLTTSDVFNENNESIQKGKQIEIKF